MIGYCLVVSFNLGAHAHGLRQEHAREAPGEREDEAFAVDMCIYIYIYIYIHVYIYIYIYTYIHI